MGIRRQLPKLSAVRLPVRKEVVRVGEVNSAELKTIDLLSWSVPDLLSGAFDGAQGTMGDGGGDVA